VCLQSVFNIKLQVLITQLFPIMKEPVKIIIERIISLLNQGNCVYTS
jgi:hypothetical protein